MKQYYILFLFFFISTFADAQAWQITEKQAMPERMTNNAVAEGFVNGVPYIYTFGGLDSTKSYSGIHLRSYRYNTQMDVWESIDSLPDTMGKIAAGASRVKDKIYIIGGYHVFANGNEVSSNKVHVFDVNSNSFLADGANIPTAIDDQVQVVWRDSLIFVITGWSNTSNVSAVQIYNSSTDVWQLGTAIPNNNTYKSFGASGAIIGDTIYYFGGASMTGSFSVQPYFRRGVINPNNPTQITWTVFSWMSTNGYRMAATTALGKVFWLGGSGVTYNYNGIAYNGSGGVSPLGRSLCYDKENNLFDMEFGYNLPMDLRGVGNVSDTIKYLVGGMEAGQQVSNKTLRLSLNLDSVLTTISMLETSAALAFDVAPNPVIDVITIKIKDFENETFYEIYTVSGVCLKQGVLTKNQQEINLQDLVEGVYLLQIRANNQVGIKLLHKRN